MYKTNKEINTYIRLLYGKPEATREYVSRLPEVVLRRYLRATYHTSAAPVVDRVIYSLSIIPGQNSRIERLERILREYHNG